MTVAGVRERGQRRFEVTVGAPGRASFRLFWYLYLEVSLVLRFAMVKGDP